MTSRRLFFLGLGLSCMAIAGTQTEFAPRRAIIAPNHAIRRLADPMEYGLSVRAGCLEIGEVYENSKFEWTVPIENHGANEIEITRFITSCSCVGTSPSALTIAPGKKGLLLLKLDLTPHWQERSVPLIRTFETSIQPAIRLPSGQELILDRWELHGKIRGVVDLSQCEVDLGKHSERRQPIPSHHIRIASLVPVHGISAKCTSPRFRIQLAPDKENPQHHDLTILPNGIIPMGRYEFEIELATELSSGQTGAPRGILVRGEIAADIQASPPKVSLGARQLGTNVHQFVTLYSLTGSGFKVIGHRAETHGLVIEPVAEDSDKGQPRLRLCQRIDDIGGQRATAIFTVENDNKCISNIRVDIEYHGLELIQE